MNTNLVSIVIPTYNRVDLLEKAVKCVLNQTYTEYEIIIVDNGILPEINYQEVISLSKKIKYEKISEHGANYARNKGIELAIGDYIAFLDDDDTWDSTKIEKSLKVFEEHSEIGLVYTDKKIFYENENISYISYSDYKNDAKHEILLKNFIGSTSCVMVRSSLVKSNNFDVLMPACQDYDLWLRLCQITDVYCIHEPLLIYYVRTNLEQISGDNSKYINAYEVIENKYSSMFSQCNTEEKKIISQNRIKSYLLRDLMHKNKSNYFLLLKELTLKSRIIYRIMWIIGFNNVIRLQSIRNNK